MTRLGWALYWADELRNIADWIDEEYQNNDTNVTYSEAQTRILKVYRRMRMEHEAEEDAP